MTRFCYLTGVPGVGKSSVADALAGGAADLYEVVHFGDLLRRALLTQSVEVDEAEMRRQARDLVTRAVVEAATGELVALLDSSDAEWCIVDSHAASQEGELFWVTPDGRRFFQRVRYDIVVVLVACPDLVLERSDSLHSGRQARSADDLRFHQRLIEAVAVQYATLCECAVVFIPSAGSVAEAVDQLARVLSDVR